MEGTLKLLHFSTTYCAMDDRVNPNEAVLVCVLSACAYLGALDQET